MVNQNNSNGAHYNYVNADPLDDSALKFGKTYHVIDAFIDTINIPQNRKNAVKFGIRAIGELLSEFPHERQNQNGEAQHEDNHESVKMAENDFGHVKSDPNAPGSGSK